MRKVLSVLVAVCLVLSFFTRVPSAKAGISGDYEYTVDTAGNATITGRISPFVGAIVIPGTLDGHTVIGIGDHAFGGCGSLTSATIPSSVTSIGDQAFVWCSSLTSVTIPSSVTSIGVQAFLACSALTGFVVDPGNPSYSSSADGVLFNKTGTVLVEYPGGKSGAYVIPSGVTSIGNSAFDSCASLASLSMPISVTTIGDWAFFGCTSLASVAIGSGVTSIGAGAFCWCSSLTAACLLGNAPTTMGADAFRNCGTGFTVRYINGTTGWTNPWYTYPTVPFASYITPSAGPGGTISPSSRVLVNAGDSQEFTISPDANNRVADVLVDGVSVGAVGSYTLSGTAAHTISASFTANTYTLTPSGGTGGTIMPYTPQMVLQGGSQSFAITPDRGFMIEMLTDNGTIISSASHQLSYTLSLTNITSSHTIAVTFMPVPDVMPPVITLPDFRTMSGVTAWSGGTVETFTTGSSPFPLTFAVEDGSGSAQWTVMVNGVVIAGGFGTGSPSASLPLAEGRNDVVVSASDAAGNRTSQQLVITCDTTGPALTIDPAVPASVTNAALTIAGSVTDAGSGLRSLTINGTAVTAYLDGSFREQLTLAGGDNTITFEAEDHVGHVTSHTFTVAYRRPSSTPSSVYVVLTVGKSAMEVNGLTHALDATPFITNGRTLLPIRSLIETLGGNVAWNAATRTATVVLGSRTVVLTIDSRTALVNGKPVTLDVAPMIVRGRSFLPLRAVAENIGLDLAWDAPSQTVSLTYWP